MVLEALPDVMLRLNAQGVVVEVFAPEETLLLAQPGDYVGAALHTLVPEPAASRLQSMFDRVRHSGALEVFEFELGQYGERGVYEARLVPVAEQQALLILRDISERKRSDRTAQSLREFLRKTLDALSAHIAILDAEGNIIDVNDAWRRFGLENGSSPQDDAIGTNYLVACGEGDEKALAIRDGIREVIEGKRETFTYEYPCDGPTERRWFNAVVTRFETAEGLRVVVAHENISEAKLAEEKRAELNRALALRNRELQEFAYVASHDLQEPLRKVRAFAQLLHEDFEDVLGDTGGHYLERIEDAGKRMSQLITDLLSFSRIATAENLEQYLDLNVVVAGVLSDLEIALNESGATVDLGELPTLEADPGQMRQLMQNLIGNAIKYRDPQRPPEVRIWSEEAPGLLRHEGLPIDAVRLHVADNGIGFDEKYLDRIFTPFKRLHTRGSYAGTGMGLAICRRIVERHGGEITARSAPDEGTTFIATLPLTQPQAQPAIEPGVPAVRED